MVLNLLDVFSLEGTLKDLKKTSYLPAVSLHQRFQSRMQAESHLLSLYSRNLSAAFKTYRGPYDRL